jgi:hypothetical protein
MACPLDTAWITLQVESVFASLTVLEPHNSSITLDEH